MKQAGIYAIVNIRSGRRYIGSTCDLHVRKSAHLSMLRRGVHENSRLQRSWNKHGSENFTFIVFEHCDVRDLPTREQYHLDACGTHVYNTGIVAAAPRLGVKWTDEQRKKATGRKASQATRQTLSKSWADKRAARTHCKHGHAISAPLTRAGCRTCRLQRKSAAYLKFAALRGPDPRIGKPASATAKATLKAAWQRPDHPLRKRGPFSEEHRSKLREAWARRKATA